MNKVLLSLFILTLAGCTTAPEGYRVDPSGAGWPIGFHRTKTVIVHEVEDPAALDPTGRDLLAFALPNVGDVCRIVVPIRLSEDAMRCGWTKELLIEHEVGHCEGVTVHKMASSSCRVPKRAPETYVGKFVGTSVALSRTVPPDTPLF